MVHNHCSSNSCLAWFLNTINFGIDLNIWVFEYYLIDVDSFLDFKVFNDLDD